MPLSRPLAPFRSQPVTKSVPRKQVAVALASEFDMTTHPVKASRKCVRFSPAAAKPRLRVLRLHSE
jgi:hypothetical protein